MMKKKRCKRCGIVYAVSYERFHNAGVWHRKFLVIRGLLAAGLSLPEIAERLGVTRVRIWQAARASGLVAARKKAA